MILNAAGEGRARGRTGTVRIPLEGPEEGGRRGRAEHWEARTMLWMGKRMACSVEDEEVLAEHPTARMCVG